MPRPHIYYDDATRAAAWRKEKEHLSNGNLALEARRLPKVLQAAAGDEFAAQVAAATVEETIKKLPHHFDEKSRQAT